VNAAMELEIGSKAMALGRTELQHGNCIYAPTVASARSLAA